MKNLTLGLLLVGFIGLGFIDSAVGAPNSYLCSGSSIGSLNCMNGKSFGPMDVGKPSTSGQVFVNNKNYRDTVCTPIAKGSKNLVCRNR
jgi:hypothetical protein